MIDELEKSIAFYEKYGAAYAEEMAAAVKELGEVFKRNRAARMNENEWRVIKY